MVNDLRNSYNYVFYSMISSWRLMLGDFDLDILLTGHPNEYSRWITVVFFIMFTLIISVVLFNALIAIMGARCESLLTIGYICTLHKTLANSRAARAGR